MRVLVVDDSAVIRDLITVNLELEGLEVFGCGDGEDALRLVQEVHPDVITMDVVMPRLNGLDAAERLRSDPETAHVPIVVVTARAGQADLDRAREIGVEGYLTKPFEPAELVALVSRLAREGRPA
ncbi:MAG TPA: response regulator [Nocardioides sp.]|nr:response regulator [Nocardioides sp.]